MVSVHHVKLNPDKLRGTVGVADGAWSTQLLGAVEDVRLAEVLNLSHPPLVRNLARAYVDAGAEYLTTNTFSANSLALQRLGVSDVTAADLVRAGARIAREAAEDRSVALIGTIGPTGSILAVGEHAAAAIIEAFAEPMRVFAAEGVDALLLETFTELEEILLAVDTARRETGLPIIASMSFDSGTQRTQTIMGAEAGVCAASLESAGAAIIGCNCGGGITTALPAIVSLRANTDRPLWVKPSAGLPDLENERAVYRIGPEDFARAVPSLLAAGANIIGGCCGVGPDHIRRVVGIVAAWRRAHR